MRTLLRRGVVMLGAAVLAWGAVAAYADDDPPQAGGDHHEAEYCAGCHFNPVMAEVVDEWYLSEHGMSFDGGSGANTYCASCKAPANWDPDATRADNEVVPWADWQDVTCASCHPEHHLRVEWGTPIGLIIDIADGEPVWTPVYDSNELCLSCHSGSRHEVTFQGFGAVMYEKKGVTCVDCHMADLPSKVVEGEDYESHTWKVEDNVPYSCGTGNSCHHNKTAEWAVKQIEKMKIHGKK